MSNNNCTQCLSPEFYNIKAQEYSTQGIPVNISKPILKILYEQLANCGLNCCENEIDFEGGITFFDEAISLGDGIQELKFVGSAVQATRVGDTVTVTVNTGSGTGLLPGDYGDITVSNSGPTITWTINNGAVSFAKIQNIDQNRLLGRANIGPGPVTQLAIGSGLNTTVHTSSPLVYQLNANVQGNNLGVVGEGIYTNTSNAVLGFKRLVAGSNVTLNITPETITINAAAVPPPTNITVYDEGSSITTNLQSINFVGSGITATGSGNITVTVPGGGGGSGIEGITIQEEGTALPTLATTLNFVGPNVTATGTGASKTITITNPTINAHPNIQFQDEGVNLGSAGTITNINFTGSGISSSLTGTNLTVNVPGGGGSGTTGSWSLLGNAGTDPNNNFIGTTDNQDLIFRRNGIKVGHLTSILTAFGLNAGQNSTVSLTAFGEDALASNTLGIENTAVGGFSLKDNTLGNSNTAIGLYSLFKNINGNENTAVGVKALFNNTTGHNNIAVGSLSLNANTTGFGNVAVGSGALWKQFSGSYNISIGSFSMSELVSGNVNTAIGVDAGRYIGSSGTVTNTISNSSIFIGGGSRSFADNQTNQIVIGNAAVGHGSDTVTIGNDSIVSTHLKGVVVVGKANSAPSGIEGGIYYNTSDNHFYGYDGTTWKQLDN